MISILVLPDGPTSSAKPDIPTTPSSTGKDWFLSIKNIRNNKANIFVWKI